MTAENQTADDAEAVQVLQTALQLIVPLVKIFGGTMSTAAGYARGTDQRALDIAHVALRATSNAGTGDAR
jgi:hypothetical protein